MHRLIVLDAAGGQEFVVALLRAWDDGDAVLPLDPRLARPAADRLVAAMDPADSVEPGDALVVPTSGTTGEPKGAVLTHDAVRAAATATSARLAVDPSADRWLACLPLAHVGGLGVVTRALLTGTPLVVHDGFDAPAVEAEARAGATLVSLVATALGRIDAGLFRTVVLGGAAPPPVVPENVVITYGMTETGGGVVYDGLPLDGVEVRVNAGQILLRGPMLLRGYRDGTSPCDADGWLATGDLGAIDEETGRLDVFGRAADVIVTGGENVWPAAVEAILATHSGVVEVAVVGRADAEWGQRVVALVVPADPTAVPELDDLRALVTSRLAAYAAPKELEVVTALPRTALGKVRRHRLP